MAGHSCKSILCFLLNTSPLTHILNAALRLDPALQKYYGTYPPIRLHLEDTDRLCSSIELNKNRWRYFRWTPRTAFISFMYAGFVPLVTGYLFWKTDVSCLTLANITTLGDMPSMLPRQDYGHERELWRGEHRRLT
jgi:hypothetical protein